MTMATKTSIIYIFSIISITLFITCSAAAESTQLRQVRRPCKKFEVYLHELRYNGTNRANATAAIVGEPAWGNKTNFNTNFGNLFVIDNPLTNDKNPNSSAVGRAQGFYVYDVNNGIGAWHGFSMVFNNTKYKGSLTLAGENPFLLKTRDLSVIGGTGDFFMHRGIATFTTIYIDPRLVAYGIKINVKLYECWQLLE